MDSKAAQLAVVYFEAYLSTESLRTVEIYFAAYASLSLALLFEAKQELSQEQELIFTRDGLAYEEILAIRHRIIVALDFSLYRYTASEVIWIIYELLGNDFRIYFDKADLVAEFLYLNYELVLCGPLYIAFIAIFKVCREYSEKKLKNRMIEIALRDFEVDLQVVNKFLGDLENFNEVKEVPSHFKID